LKFGNFFDIFVDFSLSLYIFTIWKCIVYHRLCRDGIYFDKILVSEYKLFILDLYLEFDDSGQLSTKFYDKLDDFNFKIINFPNMCSNIPASPAYGVYISQLIHYARASSHYSIYHYVKLKVLASWIYLLQAFEESPSDSYEYKIPLIYPPELEVKETTDTGSSASFLDLYLEFDDSGQLSTKFYDKGDDFNVKIINVPNICSNLQILNYW
jgi:Fe-S-cluster formation regulator IscX/YfhJ